MSGDSGAESIDQNAPATAGEQAVRLGVQAREREVAVASPRRRQGGGEVVLLGEQVDGTVTAAPRLDEHDLGRVRQHVGEQGRLGAVVEPGQPALHPLEERTLGDALPLLAPPRLAGDEPARPLAQLVARQQLTGGEDQRLGEVAGRALVVDAERRQPVDLVAPQVDAHRGVAGRREHVDDRPSAGELAAVLDELLAAVAEVDEAADQLVGIDDVAVAHDDRLGGQRPGTEALEQGPHAGDDHARAALRIRVLGPPEPAPQHLEAPTHRLDRRAEPLERQRLPGRQHDDITSVVDELGEVVGELAGHRPGRRGDEQRAVVRQPGQGGDGDRAGDLADRQPRAGVAEGARQPRLVAQQRGEIS